MKGDWKDRVEFLETLLACVLIEYDRPDAEEIIRHATTRAGSTDGANRVAAEYRKHVFGSAVGISRPLCISTR